MESLFSQIIAASSLDWMAIITSMVYVWLAARNNNWCWLFAAISTALWGWQSFFTYNLVSDGLLQVFYFIMAGVGLWRWTRDGHKRATISRGDILDTPAISISASIPIQSMSHREHLLVIIGGFSGGLTLGYLFSNTLVVAATYPDAITTVFSIITTFLLIGRRLENWLYWVVIDIAYVWIYASTGGILFAIMMILNVGMAIYGYLNWRQEIWVNELPS